MRTHLFRTWRALWFLLPSLLFGQPNRPDVDAAKRNLLVTANLTSSLQKEINRAATAGYRVVAASKAYEYFPSFLIAMERVTEPRETYNYLVVATQKTSTLEKELGEAGVAGFRLLPHTLMVSPVGVGLFKEIVDPFVGGEIFAVMEKAPNSTDAYEYRVDVSTCARELETDIGRRVSEGYRVAGMVSRGEAKSRRTARVQHIVVVEKPRGAPPLLAGAASRPDMLPSYRVLYSNFDAGLQERLGQAAKEGYCLRFTSWLGEALPERSGTEADHDYEQRLASALASRAIVAILEKAAQPPDGCRYLFLGDPERSSWEATHEPGEVSLTALFRGDRRPLDDLLQRAGDQGFRPHPAGIIQSPLAVIMEKAPGGAENYQYVLIETKSFGKFEKKFKEASAQGYRVVGASRSREIPVVILEKSAATRAEPATAAEQAKVPSKPFTNDDVLKLVKAGFGEETILEAIRTNWCQFDASAEALLALKNAGVGEKIIMAMLAAGRVARAPSAPSRQSDALPARPGIYVLKDGTYIPLEIEPVEWRPRGWESTSGSVKTTRLKADMANPESSVQLSGSPEFLLVCPDCVWAMEYQLLRAEPKKKGREFRVEFQSLVDDLSGVPGGTSQPVIIIRGTAQKDVTLSGTGKNKAHFTAKELVPGKFRLTVPELGKGEYAFLPPTKGFSGRLYTFGLR